MIAPLIRNPKNISEKKGTVLVFMGLKTVFAKYIVTKMIVVLYGTKLFTTLVGRDRKSRKEIRRERKEERGKTAEEHRGRGKRGRKRERDEEHGPGNQVISALKDFS